MPERSSRRGHRWELAASGHEYAVWSRPRVRGGKRNRPERKEGKRNRPECRARDHKDEPSRETYTSMASYLAPTSPPSSFPLDVPDGRGVVRLDVRPARLLAAELRLDHLHESAHGLRRHRLAPSVEEPEVLVQREHVQPHRSPTPAPVVAAALCAALAILSDFLRHDATASASLAAPSTPSGPQNRCAQRAAARAWSGFFAAARRTSRLCASARRGTRASGRRTSAASRRESRARTSARRCR